MTTDGTPWRSGSAEFDDVGFSLVKRDIEVLMIAIQNLKNSLGSAGVDAAAVESIINGRLPWKVTEGGTGADNATDARTNLGLGTLATKSAVNLAADVTGVLPWPNIATLGLQTAENHTDTSDATPFVITATYTPTNWQVYFALYEKRPRYNAKWLRGTEVSGTAPTDPRQLLQWDSGTSMWTPKILASSKGDLVTTDGSVLYNLPVGSDGAVLQANSSTSTGLTWTDAPTANNQLLYRSTAGVLSWLTAPSDGQMLGLVGSTFGFTRSPTLGTNASGGGTFKVYFAAGKYVEITSTGVVTVYQSATSQVSIDASSTVKITYANSNTVTFASADFLGWTSKDVRIREVSICESGLVKKMLALCSASY